MYVVYRSIYQSPVVFIWNPVGFFFLGIKADNKSGATVVILMWVFMLWAQVECCGATFRPLNISTEPMLKYGLNDQSLFFEVVANRQAFSYSLMNRVEVVGCVT